MFFSDNFFDTLSTPKNGCFFIALSFKLIYTYLKRKVKGLNMKKLLILSTFVLVVVCLMVGCASSSEIDYVEFSIAIEGVDGVTEFTTEDAKQAEFTTLESSITNQSGTTKEYSFGGVLLTDMLYTLGIDDYEVITIEASDGFSADFDKVALAEQGVVLAWLESGEPLEDNSITVAPEEGSGKNYIKFVTKIIVQ